MRESLLAGPLPRSCLLWIGGMIALAASGPLSAAEELPTRPMQPRPGQVRTAGGVAATARTASRADERTPNRSAKVDHAVIAAGGMAAGQPRCSHCQRSACPQCRLPEPHHDGHSRCQHGLCPAHCPVRPDVFGFYGTRWRRWPGSGVVQASNNEAATPARPPRAEVPGVQEESLEPDAPADTAAGDDGRADEPARGDAPARAEEPAGADEPEGEATSAVHPTEGSSDESEVPEQVVSQTAWRTFTVAPPRLAAQQ